MVIKKLKILNRRHFDRFGKWVGGFFDNPRDFLRVVLPQGLTAHIFDDNERYCFSMDNPGRLGEVATIKGDFKKFINNYLDDVEREIAEKYCLDANQLIQYRNEANEIINEDDRYILIRLGLPVDNPSNVSDVYRRVLYYIAELCNNGREIRADFFRAVS